MPDAFGMKGLMKKIMKKSNSEDLGLLNHRREILVDKKNSLISSMRQTKPRNKRKVEKFDKRIEKKLEEIELICDKIHKQIRLSKKAGTWENQIDSML